MKTKAAGKQNPAPPRPLYATSFSLCGIFVVGVESKNMPRPLATPPNSPPPRPHVMFAGSVVGMFALAACGKWHIINSN